MKIPRKRFEATIPAMAMGDIAFLLLIFFLILAKVQDDSHLKWLPAKALDIEQAQNSRVSVLIDVDNKTYLNGKEIGVGQLADQITNIIGDSQPDDRAVLLKAHKDTTAVYFEPVMEAISEAGGTVYHILEKEQN